jgi:hypothetical protein
VGIVGRRQAPARRQVELPAVHRAGQDRAANLAEAAQIAAHVRAATLGDPLAQLDLLLVVGFVGVPAFGVHQPLG